MKRLSLLPLLALLAGCGTTPTEPAPAEPAAEESELLVVAGNETSTVAMTKVCYGQIIRNIASTWPWAIDHESFPPPPGSIALWLEVFTNGQLTVRDLQQASCDPT